MQKINDGNYAESGEDRCDEEVYDDENLDPVDMNIDADFGRRLVIARHGPRVQKSSWRMQLHQHQDWNRVT